MQANPQLQRRDVHSASLFRVELTADSLDRFERVAKIKQRYISSFGLEHEYAPQQRASWLLQALAEICRCNDPIWLVSAKAADRVSTSDPATELFASLLERTEGRELDQAERDVFTQGFESLDIKWLAAIGLAEQCRALRRTVFKVDQ